MTEEAPKYICPIEPMHDYIVLHTCQRPQITAGGVWVPVSALDEENLAIVLAVGPGRRSSQDGKRIPMSVVPGDLIIYGKITAAIVQAKGRSYLMMKDHDILGIWRGGRYTDEKLMEIDPEVTEETVLPKEVLVEESTTSNTPEALVGRVLAASPGSAIERPESPQEDSGEGRKTEVVSF